MSLLVVAVARIVIALLVVVCALWFALRFLPAGADAAVPVLPYMIALTPFLWIPELVCAVAAAAIGDWRVTAAALLGVFVVFFSQWPYWRSALRRRSDGSDDGAHSDDGRNDGAAAIGAADGRAVAGTRTAMPNAGGRAGLTVMTLNCRYGRADANAIVDLVRERRVRVLALQELTPGLVRRLDDAGLDTLLPHRVLGEDREDDNGGFNGVWTAAEPVESERCAVRIPAAQTPSAVVAVCGPGAAGDADNGGAHGDVSGADRMMVRFVSAHTFSPMRGVREWSAGIRGLAELTDDWFGERFKAGGGWRWGINGQTDTPRRVTVVMGDLNSGIDHPSFHTLLRAGFRDAALEEARGKHATFPRWTPWPRLVLDHVLAYQDYRDKGAVDSGLDVDFRGVRSIEVPGTDHLALVATLGL